MNVYELRMKAVFKYYIIIDDDDTRRWIGLILFRQGEASTNNNRILEKRYDTFTNNNITIIKSKSIHTTN